MAKGREHRKFQENDSESTEEEEAYQGEESEEGDSSDSGFGREQNPIAKKWKGQSQAASRTQKETGSASGSESDSEAPVPNASGPVDGPETSGFLDTGTSSGVSRHAAEVKKSKKKPMASVLHTSVVKRPAEENDSDTKNVKKSKKDSSEHEFETSAKKPLFQRIWSEDDEIVILKGMIDYAEKMNSDPVTDLNTFHKFIKNNLHVDVTRSQLQDKIRRLKKKYENRKGKEKEGKLKAHEKEAYELSKLIWGCENGNGSRPKVSGSVLRRHVDRVWSSSAMKSIDMSIDQRVYRIGAELFEGKDAAEGASEWRVLAVQEIEIHLKMLDLKRAKAKLVLDALSP